MKQFIPSTLSLLLAGSLAGCLAGGSDDSDKSQQLLRGHIPLERYASEVIGVRVVAEGQAVAAVKTDALGNFNIGVPRGRNYSFEVVTRDGARTVLTGPIDGLTPMNFDVCDPGEDFDLGNINPFDFEGIDGDEHPWSDTEDDCSVPPWICEDAGPNGEMGECWDEPLPCDDPAASPDFCWDEPLPCADPASDPDFCWDDPEPCDGNNPYDPTFCPPPPPPDCWSMDPADCDTDPWTPEPCDSANPEDCDPWIPEPCDSSDPNCEDPWDGGCMSDYDDPSCWPQPDVCIMTPDGGFMGCDDQVGGAPDFPFPDFGCQAE